MGTGKGYSHIGRFFEAVFMKKLLKSTALKMIAFGLRFYEHIKKFMHFTLVN